MDRLGSGRVNDNDELFSPFGKGILLAKRLLKPAIGPERCDIRFKPSLSLKKVRAFGLGLSP